MMKWSVMVRAGQCLCLGRDEYDESQGGRKPTAKGDALAFTCQQTDKFRGACFSARHAGLDDRIRRECST